MGIAPGHHFFLHILVDGLFIHCILQKNSVAWQILALNCLIWHVSAFEVQ